MSNLVRIDGNPVAPAEGATVTEPQPGAYSVLTAEGRSYEVRVSADEITIGPYRFKYEIDDPRQWKRSGGGAGAQGSASIVAPMPGKAIRVLVSVGDEVAEGQGIVVVEAMKMQNEMKTPRAGRVASILVKGNDSVNAGAVLAVIE
jgi:biotin carboxyl carrier protein